MYCSEENLTLDLKQKMKEDAGDLVLATKIHPVLN